MLLQTLNSYTLLNYTSRTNAWNFTFFRVINVAVVVSALMLCHHCVVDIDGIHSDWMWFWCRSTERFSRNKSLWQRWSVLCLDWKRWKIEKKRSIFFKIRSLREWNFTMYQFKSICSLNIVLVSAWVIRCWFLIIDFHLGRKISN